MKFKMKLLNSLLLCVNTLSYADQSDNPIGDSRIENNQTDYLSFNSASLFGNKNGVDLGNYKIKNYIAPGEYLVGLEINGQNYSKEMVKFDHLNSNPSAVLCIDSELIEKLDLKKNIKLEIFEKKLENECLTIKDLDSDAYYDFDKSEMILSISLPQAITMERPKGYINPKLFSAGVNSAFIGYDFNYNNDDQDNETKYLSLKGGLNLGGWYFRHAGTFESDRLGIDDYYSTQNVLYKDINEINSRLSLGQFYTQGYYLDSLPIVGTQLAFDQEMLPWSERNYSPVIQNFAHTNALVRVYQNGQKIYERTVPAGPFELRDVNTSVSGDLTLEITENGGEKRSFTMPLQSSQDLIKKGRYNYSFSTGRYFIQKKTTDDQVSQASFNYGINNHATLISGLTYNEDYYAGLFALALNTPIGGLTARTEFTDADLYGKNYKGSKYGLNYSYAWLPQSLNIYASYNRFSQDYLSTSSFFYQKNFDDISQSEKDEFFYSYSLKENMNLSINKNFENRNWGGLNLSVSQNKYWNTDSNYYQYSFSYSNFWEKLSYRLGFTHTDYNNDHRDRQNTQDKSIYLSLSMPLDWRSSRGLYANASIDRDDQESNASLSVSGSLDQDNKSNFGIGVSKNGDDHSDLYANLSYLFPKVNLGTTLSLQDQDKLQYSLSASGAVVAHRYGITPVNTLSDTFTIVHVEGGKGAKVDNAWGVKLDRFGNAISANSQAYTVNQITINPEDLDANISLESNQTEVIPKKYSSQLATFKTQHLSNVILRIRYQEHVAPLGSQLMSHDQQQPLGVVGPAGQLIVQKTTPLLKGSIVRWGDAEDQSCLIAPLTDSQLTVPEQTTFKIITVECKAQ